MPSKRSKSKDRILYFFKIGRYLFGETRFQFLKLNYLISNCVKYSKKRETVPDLPLWLWYSFGSMASLLQEVISIYPAIMPPTLTAGQSNRVCNALALMQCVASHKETRSPFLQGIFQIFG